MRYKQEMRCHKCGKKIWLKGNRKYCKECAKKTKWEKHKKWKEDNPEKLKEFKRIEYLKHRNGYLRRAKESRKRILEK